MLYMDCFLGLFVAGCVFLLLRLCPNPGCCKGWSPQGPCTVHHLHAHISCISPHRRCFVCACARTLARAPAVYVRALARVYVCARVCARVRMCVCVCTDVSINLVDVMSLTWIGAQCTSTPTPADVNTPSRHRYGAVVMLTLPVGRCSFQHFPCDTGGSALLRFQLCVCRMEALLDVGVPAAAAALATSLGCEACICMYSMLGKAAALPFDPANTQGTCPGDHLHTASDALGPFPESHNIDNQLHWVISPVLFSMKAQASPWIDH